MLIFTIGLIFLLLAALSCIFVPLRGKASTRFVIVLAAIFTLIALGAYFIWGNPQAASNQFERQQTQEQQLMTELQTPQQIIDKLQQAVQANPTDPKGWFLLGRMYMSIQNFSKAKQAFAKADTLDPNNPQIMLEYAQVLFALNKNKLTPAASALLQKIITQQPDNAGVINLLALNAYQQGNYQQAIDYWQQLLATAPPDSESAKTLQRAIAAAKKKMT